MRAIPPTLLAGRGPRYLLCAATSATRNWWAPAARASAAGHRSLCGGEPCGPLHCFSGGIHPHQCPGNLRSAGAGQGLLVGLTKRSRRIPIPARLHGRGLRLAGPRRSGLFRDHGLRAQQPLCGFEGGLGSFGKSLLPHLGPAGAHHKLLQQLRAVSVSREADSADDSQRAGGQACPFTAMGRMCATGSLWKIIARRFALFWKMAASGRLITSAATASAQISTW
jgi:hypothetical protein